jgi:hypothetical protein
MRPIFNSVLLFKTFVEILTECRGHAIRTYAPTATGQTGWPYPHPTRLHVAMCAQVALVLMTYDDQSA